MRKLRVTFILYNIEAGGVCARYKVLEFQHKQPGQTAKHCRVFAPIKKVLL